MKEACVTHTPVLLSVVIPALNVEAWIDETLHSVLTQDVAGLQVIVVDDGSTDGTLEILHGWADRDPRLEVISSGGVGGGSARNTGVAKARGTFLVFCDADDIVPRGAYRKLVEQLERTGSDIAAGRYLKFSASLTWDPTQNWPVYKSVVEGTTLSDSPSLIRGRACWNKMFRMDFWREQSLSFPDAPRSNDIYPMTAAMTRASTIDVIPDVVYLYRDRPGARSMTAKASTFAGVLSYLDQELRCADELTLDDDSTLTAIYGRLLLQADLWVHLMRLVAGLNEGITAAEIDAEGRVIADRVSSLFQAIPRNSIPSLRPEQQAVYDTIRRRGFADLAGLNERGSVGQAASLGESRQVNADWLTALRLQGMHEGFVGLPITFLRDRVLRPLETLIDRGDIDGAIAWSALASSLPHLGEQDLTQLTPGERTLLTLCGDERSIRRVATMRGLPAPTATLANRRNTFAVTIPTLPLGVDVSVTASNRDTQARVTLAKTSNGTRTSLRISGNDLPHDGVWQLELTLFSDDLQVDLPVLSLHAEPGWPAHRWHRAITSPILKAGDQVVVVRRRALPLRLALKATQKASRLLPSRTTRG
jgi:glycosyltransferase involved in cell wall biosynthesis